MAKVRCARCGNVFALQGSEIQLCPQCGCRMRINRPQPAVSQATPKAQPEQLAVQSNAEYENLRKEYMDMMRTRLAEERKTQSDVVCISKAEYKELVERAAIANASKPAPAPVAPQPEPVSAPTFEPVSTPIVSAPAPVSEPAPTFSPADTWSSPSDDYIAPDDYAGNDYADEEETEVAKPRSRGLVASWIAFIIALGAGVLSGLLTIFKVFYDPALKANVIKGSDILIPNGGWTEANIPINIIVALCFFLPALLALITFIVTVAKGKVMKFILAFLYLIAGVLLFGFPIMFDLSMGVKVTINGELFMNTIERSAIIVLIAAGVCAVAFIALLVAGIATKSKKREKKQLFEEEEDFEDEELV